MKKHTHEIDHIDPKWEEGRDYQKVCGLNVVHNLCERETSLNSSKNNRFLPWRNCRDEIGVDPVEQGDLCLFLDPDTNEWVLEEFLGRWWNEKAKRNDSRTNRTYTDEQRGGMRRRRLQQVMPKWNLSQETKDKIAEAVRGREVSEETRRKLSEYHTGKILSEETKRKVSEFQRDQVHSEEWNKKVSEGVKRYHRLKRARERCRRMSLSDPQMPDFED